MIQHMNWAQWLKLVQIIFGQIMPDLKPVGSYSLWLIDNAQTTLTKEDAKMRSCSTVILESYRLSLIFFETLTD